MEIWPAIGVVLLEGLWFWRQRLCCGRGVDLQHGRLLVAVFCHVMGSGLNYASFDQLPPSSVEHRADSVWRECSICHVDRNIMWCID